MLPLFPHSYSQTNVSRGMDTSFPAATIILSNAVSREHQGIAAALVNTVVNYSISLGLGLAGTVEVHVNNGGMNKEDLLFGYRSAWWVGCGCAGLGLLVSLIYLARSFLQDSRNRRVQAEVAEK